MSAKLNYVKAAKNYPDIGVKKGEMYYWWQLFRQPKRRSKYRPRPSQLEGSEYTSTAYAFEERAQDAVLGFMGGLGHHEAQVEGDYDIEALISELEEIKSDVENFGSEQDDKFNNMLEGPQQSETGQLLEARRDACSTVADSIQEAVNELENLKDRIAEIERQIETDEDAEESDKEIKPGDEGWQALKDELDELCDQVNSAVDSIDWTWE